MPYDNVISSNVESTQSVREVHKSYSTLVKVTLKLVVTVLEINVFIIGLDIIFDIKTSH